MSVLQFPRQPVKGLRERGAPANADPFLCFHCDSEIFKLFNDGTVYCAALGCGRFISNLKVTK